jgi:ADP-ribose pyrophosphatase YjhB (NUDIX family)
VGAFVIVRDPTGRVLWVRRTDYNVWNLPGGGCGPQEAPWEAAVRETREETGLEVRLTGLSGVYVKPEQSRMALVFAGEVAGGELTTGPEAAGFAMFGPGQEPANSLPKHVERAADACSGAEQTVFKVQAGPPGLELLGLRPARLAT